MSDIPGFDPTRDLLLERVVDVPRRLVWAAWTTPEHLKQWFTPRPWRTIDCRIDLRPGGEFFTVMCSPEGMEMPNAGCYLEVLDQQRLTWTSALEPGFRPVAPSSDDGPGIGAFTASIMLEDEGEGTRYRALAMHQSEASRVAHEKMGFHDGWGAALDQLVAHMKTQA